MRSDDSANKTLYGQELTATQIVREGAVKALPAAKPLLSLLERVTPGHAR